MRGQVSPGKFCERELLVFPGYKVGSIQLITLTLCLYAGR
jgi:hypothetical protein